MSSLVTTLTFGIVGAITAAALMGILLLASTRTGNKPVRIVCAALYVLLLFVVPSLAGLVVLDGTPSGGFLYALPTTFGVCLLIFVINVAMAIALNRGARARGRPTQLATRPTPGLIGAVLVAAGLFSLAPAELAVVLS